MSARIPHGILTDLDSLKAYQQLGDDLRVFQVVLMYHFFKKANAEERQTFADAARTDLGAFYEQYCKIAGQPDCGPNCWNGSTCVECFSSESTEAKGE